jgi:tetratricopeptide (TPR) repeat protein
MWSSRASATVTFATALAPIALAGAFGLAPALLGCAAATGTHAPVAHGERITVAASEVSDDGFASALHDLLLAEPATAERGVRLGAVVGRQLARAADRFKEHSSDHGDRGMAALAGALYLVHAGEPTAAMFGAHGAEALSLGVRELALHGDEGRAQALYDLWLQVAPPAEQADIRGHLHALDAWIRAEDVGSGALTLAGGIERVAVRRRLLEPSDQALADAVRATTDWMGRAIALRDKFRKTRVQPPREESAEAWRALETGPLVLACLFLRDGDVPGALSVLERSDARELLESEQPQFAAALVAAAQERSVAKYVELLVQLRRFTGHEQAREEEDFEDDRDLFAAAAFALAAACYRLDPTVPQVALSLVVALDDLGMAEATPAILVEALRAHPDATVASETLGLALAAMGREEDAGDPAAARRAFHAAAPLLAIASDKSLAGKVRPSAAHLRAAMGEIELREGRIDQARALLQESAGEERLASVLLPLARIEWRDGQTRRALDDLRDALSAPDAAQAPALRGEILLTISDITRDQGDVAAARPPLTDALRELVRSRGAENGDERARIERVLARVLGRFGAVQPAQRALERAYAAAPGDKRQAAQTIELQVGGAFVRGDIAAARDGLARALAADLDGDDLVYFALWVKLLERQVHAVEEGAADRVFASIGDDGRWIATLARFGEGKIKGDDLIARAVSPVQKYEALFYAAMDRRAAGDAKGGDALLRQVVAGTGMELTEVTLARDILDANRAAVGGPLPPDVAIP